VTTTADDLVNVARPLLLDLYCGAGGCSVGYYRAGFQVVGVDIEPHPDYPYEFVQADALAVLRDEVLDLSLFAAIHGSPPCKSETSLRHLHKGAARHPNLLGPTLGLLSGMDTPWVVENVAATKQMPGALVVCGAALGLGARCRDGIYRPLRRHRRFESNVFLMGPGCACDGREPVGVYGNGSGGTTSSRRAQGSRSGYQATKAEASEAMGIEWMGVRDLSQAIPPAYTELIGDQLMARLTEGGAA
jgi:DNA (cytosine-5)-methyltransferase 1